MNTVNTSNFNYETFDRQMAEYINMSYLLVGEWDDCTQEEMMYDLRSLCVKGSRLCNQIDTDLALQQQDLTQSRKEINQNYYLSLNTIIQYVSELTFRAIDEMRLNKGLERPSAADFQMDFGLLMPKLQEWIAPKTENKQSYEALAILPNLFSVIESELGTGDVQMDSWKKNLLNLFKYFASLCLLLIHFQNLAEMTDEEVSSEEAARLLTAQVLAYQETEKGRQDMRNFIAVMKYEHEGCMPQYDELVLERRMLIKQVPVVFQTCFMEHIEDINELAMSIVKIKPLPSDEDFEALLSAIAKYQWISEYLYEYDHPKKIKSEIYNRVFYASINGKPVDFKRLRKRIERMLHLIEKKNHWFCIYNVLKYHNYIQDNVATHFAEQMQHPDWFPHLPEPLRFSGETLTEYNGYLNDHTFVTWSRERYDSFRLLNGKKKWSPDLWRKFQRLCYELNDCFEEKL